jgi:hypothetical protein
VTQEDSPLRFVTAKPKPCIVGLAVSYGRAQLVRFVGPIQPSPEQLSSQRPAIKSNDLLKIITVGLDRELHRFVKPKVPSNSTHFRN